MKINSKSIIVAFVVCLLIALKAQSYSEDIVIGIRLDKVNVGQTGFVNARAFYAHNNGNFIDANCHLAQSPSPSQKVKVKKIGKDQVKKISNGQVHIIRPKR